MSRVKKKRSGGNMDVIVVRNRTQKDVEGRLRKKDKKKKGLKTGSRHSSAEEKQIKAAKEKRDPRLGSKKPISLVPPTVDKPTKAQKRLSAEQELAQLENDAQLMVLLERIENGEKLGPGLQSMVDEKLDRIEALMDQLGLFEQQDDSDKSHADQQTTVAAKPNKNKPTTDEDLLGKFEDLDLNDFK